MEEYPKWVKGKLANNAEEEAAILGVSVAKLPGWTAPGNATTPPGYVPVEYPKFVLGKLVNSEDEELAVLDAQTARDEISMEAAARVGK